MAPVLRPLPLAKSHLALSGAGLEPLFCIMARFKRIGSRERSAMSTESHSAREPATPLEWTLSFARGYLELGMLRHAERELDTLPVHLQDAPAVMSLRSHVLVARRRWRSVVAHARRAVRLFPEAPEYYVHAATAFDMLGQRDESRRVWESAPEMIRTNGVLHLHVARFEARLGNVAAARDHLASALDLDPDLRAVASRDPHLTAVLAAHAEN